MTISPYRRIKNTLYLKFSSHKSYSAARFVMERVFRPLLKISKHFLSRAFMNLGIVIIWEQYGTVSNFFKNRYILIHGFNGITFLGKSIYVSKETIRFHYRESSNLQIYTSNILDATGKNLIPISFIDTPFVKDGTFKVKKRFQFRSAKLSHKIGDSDSGVIVPFGYAHFGHFLPQLVPFLVRHPHDQFFLNLPDPDDINRNLEILDYFGISAHRFNTRIRPLHFVSNASQVGLYPASSELSLIRGMITARLQIDGGSELGSGRRFYLSRLTARDGRRVVNEEAVLNSLENFGFRAIDPSSLSYADSTRLFHNAEIVIGPFGSAFFHTLAMQQGSTIIEFSGDRFVRWQVKKMAVDAGFHHKLIICETLPNLDIIVDIASLMEILSKVIRDK